MSKAYYTDGACSSNGYKESHGGYGVVLVNEETNEILWEYQEFKAPTTNNEMELMAILKAMQHGQNEFAKPTIYTDSAYCCNLINTWMFSWARNGWKRPKNQEVKNLEIIKQIYELAPLYYVKKVDGHSGIIGNEIADQLATGKRKIKT